MKSFAWGVLAGNLFLAMINRDTLSMDITICAICVASILQPKEPE